MRDAGRLQPIAQSLEITGHRAEGTDLLGRPLTRRAGQHTRHHRLLMHIQPSTSLDNHLHRCLPRQKGDRDAAGTIKTLPHVLPVPRGDKEWYLYATRAGLIIGVANHRRVVSLNTIARREVRTIRPAPQLKTAQPPPPFSPIVVRATRRLADQQSPPTACTESHQARSPCARADHLFVSPHRIPKLSASLKPATLFKFHKALVHRKYRLLFSSSCRRRKPGPKGPSAQLIAAIVEMKHRNPKFGCVRIAQQIAHAFGIEINKDVVRRVLSKHFRLEPGADGPSWLTLIAHAKDSVWSVDLFRVESILLRSHWVMLVMDVFTRRIIGFGIAPACIDGVSVCRMFNCATAGRPKPKYLSTDHDPLFRFHRGWPICACWRSRRSSRFGTLRSRIRSSNG